MRKLLERLHRWLRPPCQHANYSVWAGDEVAVIGKTCRDCGVHFDVKHFQ